MPSLYKSSKSVECPVNRKVGHKSFLIVFWDRVLGIAKKSTNGKKRKAGSNAGYHLSGKQVQKLIQACDSLREKLLIQIMVYTGIRRAEVVDLDISDIRWDDSLILIKKGKGNKMRLIPLPDFIKNDLKYLVGKKTNGAVFESRKGGNLSYRQLNRIVASIGYRAGVINPNPKQSNIACHLLRHTFARYWKRNKGSMESLSYILGHTSQATTMDLYGKESISDMQENYKAVYRKNQI